MVIQDVRRLVFPLLSAELEGGIVQTDTLAFHGTAFFVSASGLALSASHIVPTAQTLGTRKLFAGVQRKQFEFFSIKKIDAWQPNDVCCLHVAIDRVDHFSCSYAGLHPGEDVWSVGIPEHELWEKGKKQTKVLKGHVAYAATTLVELSFPIPKGMSGSPVLVGQDVFGVLIGNWRSEQLEDRVEEIVEVSNTKEVIRFVESKEIINSGVATDLAMIKELPAYIADASELGR